MLPPLKSLLYFNKAAELGSFKLAAEQLHVSQAAVSQQIRLLESHLNCVLFKRDIRQVELTEEGLRLYPYLSNGFKQIEQGVNLVKSDSQPNTLSLSVLPSFASCWLMPKVTRFQAQNTNIKLRIDPSDQHADFDKDIIDAGIRFGLGNYPNLQSEFLAHDSMVLAFKPGLIDLDKPIRPQLLKQKLIMDICPDAESAWAALLQKFDISSDDHQPFLEIDNAALVLQTVLSGQGIAVLRKQLLGNTIELGQLSLFPDFEQQCNYAYYFVAPKHHFERDKIQRFLAWLKGEFNQA